MNRLIATDQISPTARIVSWPAILAVVALSGCDRLREFASGEEKLDARAIRGRVAAEVPYAPYAGSAREQLGAVPVRTTQSRQTGSTPNVEAMHWTGAVPLDLLEHRWATAPGDPVRGNDLAVAYLSLADAGSEWLLLKALAVVTSIEDEGPPWLSFNRYLLYSRLGLRRLAQSELAKLERIEPSSPWTLEIRKSEDAFNQQVDGWRRLEETLLRSPEKATEPELTMHAYQGLQLLEGELLELWVADELRVDRAPATAIQRIGDVLSARGDWFWRQWFEEASMLEEACRDRALDEVRLVVAGLEQYRTFDLAAAVHTLGTAARIESPCPGSLRLFSTLYLGFAEIASEPQRSRRHLERVLEEAVDSGAVTIAGRAHWGLGTLDAVANDWRSAIEHHEQALRLLEEAGGPAAGAGPWTVLADDYQNLGDLYRAWNARVNALQSASLLGSPRRVHAALLEASDGFLESRELPAARLLQQEMVRNAMEWREESAIGEAAGRLGRTLAMLGDSAAASALIALEQAVASSDPRDQIAALQSAWVLTSEDNPVEAEASAAELVALHERTGFRWDIAAAWRAQAVSLRRSGNIPAALERLHQTYALYSERVLDQPDPLARLMVARAANDVAADVSDIHLEEGEILQALAWSERARCGLYWTCSASSGSEEFSRMLGRVPPDETIIVFGITGSNEFTRWTVRKGSLDLETIGSRSEVEFAIGAATLALRRGDAGWRQRLLEMRKTLLPSLEDGSRLTVVPAGRLSDVPWLALPTEKGALLGEEIPVRVIPALTWLDSRASARATGRVVLAVAAESDGLPLLPRTLEEAARLEGIYAPTHRVRRAAYVDELSSELEQAEVFHYAGHGRTSTDLLPLGSELLMGERKLSSRDLYGREFEQLRFAVIGSCRSADPIGDPNSASFGVASALIAGGAGTVIASLWDLSDRDQGWLARLHEHYVRGVPPGEILFRSIRESSPHRGDHPPVWASFVNYSVGGSA